jgi:hypothetical protein
MIAAAHMTYPARSSFNSAQDQSAWYIIMRQVGTERFRVICTTDGFRFIRYLQALIKSALPAAGLNDWAGRTIRPTDITIDSAWGHFTTRGLAALMLQRNGPSVLIDNLRLYVDAQQRINVPAIAAAVWLIHRLADNPVPGEEAGINPANILVPTDAVMPPWGTSPPRPAGWQAGPDALNCVRMPAGEGGTPAPAPGPPPSQQPVVQQQPTGTGTVATATTSMPGAPSSTISQVYETPLLEVPNVPPSEETPTAPTVAARPSMVIPIVVGVTAVALLGVGAYFAFRAPPKAAKSPKRSRRAA